MHRWRSILATVLSMTTAGLLVASAVASLGWFAYSHVTGAQFVVFRTGSMSPTIPQGAVAIGVPRPASELAVGDVVTVWPAGDRLPVTHRVTRLAPDPQDPAARLVTMRGDGNARDDRAPYRVAAGLVIVASAPGLAPVLDQMRSPLALGLGSLLASVAVLWALWPASAGSAPRRTASA